MMNPACEVNEKGTRGKNDVNEVLEEGSSPLLDLYSNEVIEAIEETLSYTEEDWQDSEQMEGLREFGTRPTVCDSDMTERQDKTHQELQSLRR